MCSQTLEGFIVDNQTKEALAFANISFLGKNVGTSANEKGFFTLDISKNQKDTLFVSFIGYENTLILLSNYTEKRTYHTRIELLPKIEDIEEVIVYKSSNYKTRKTVLGTFNRKNIYPVSLPFGEEKAIFIENAANRKGKIEEVTLYFKKESSSVFEKFPAIFKINFYKKGSDNFPNGYLSNELFFVKPTEKESKITLKLSEYAIFFPKEGFFVGIEVVNPSSEVPKTSMYATSPNLVYTHTNKNIAFSRFRGKEWHKMTGSSRNKQNFYAVPRIKINALLYE